MKITITWQRRSSAGTSAWLCWSRALMVVGLALLGYVSYIYADAAFYQAYQNWRFRKALQGSASNAGEATLSLATASTDILQGNSEVGERRPEIAGHSTPLGRIEIDAVGLDAMILEGTGELALRRGLGHIPGTSLPGQQGNVAIAGHRDTFFRPLREIRREDEITLTTLNGSYRYHVVSTKVVQPEAVEVLDASSEATLTLITCYPFNFVGPAPLRFVVSARRNLP